MKDKNVLITGASSGIGLACADVLAEAGANLILLARRKDRLEELKSKLESKYNINVLAIGCDIRNFDKLSENLNNLPAKWHKIDVLINNAGKALGLSKIQDGDLADWEEMIDTNIKGLLYVSKLILPKMVQQGYGHVINIGSIAGREVYPNGNVYCGTKSAVASISKGMVIDLNGTGIKVTNIEPGLVETEFSEVRFHGDKEKAKNVYLGYTPLTGKDIADIILFVLTRPKHVMIQDILVTPTDQASTMIIHKE